MNYYNEIDPKACAWLSELMAEGLIPKGEIDQRSIVDVRASDLRGFRQCHFFAGIGGWPYALRLAGWGEDREVWTGSCPCQPLSCAGKGKGDADERHLWPAFYRLISERRPAVVFGEQVASKAGREWFSGVRADLEGMGYACGGADLCSAGVGSPNIRQRLYWVAYAAGGRINGGHFDEATIGLPQITKPDEFSDPGRLADAEHCRHGQERNGEGRRREPECGGEHEWLANAPSGGLGADRSASRQTGHAELGQQNGGMDNAKQPRLEGYAGNGNDGHQPGRDGAGTAGSIAEASQPGFWSSAIWHQCRDGKQRRIPRIESLLQRMASGLPNPMDGLCPEDAFPLCSKIEDRVALLKGYGNAINPWVAKEFIEAVMECI